MRTVIVFICLTISASAIAQSATQVTHRQLQKSINDDGKTLTIDVNGEQDNGEKIAYKRTFDVAKLSTAQKEALKTRVLDSLGVNTETQTPINPEPPKIGTETVTFNCATCLGKNKLEVSGEGYSSTREFDSKKEKQSSFPYTLTLNPGDYKLRYWQNDVLQMQSTFTVKAGSENVVKVK